MTSMKQLRLLTQRIMRQNLTDGDTIVTVIAMPIFMLLFFVYIIGGNVVTTSGTAPSLQHYLSYALPGFLLVAMASGSAYTALRINNDKMMGFLDRLHTMPIKRWVILSAHVLASVIFMLLSELGVLIVGLLIGYRGTTDPMKLLQFLGISILFALMITLLAIPFSLKAKNSASASSFSYLILMLLFVSSAFLPTTGMAKAVRIFADNQPMTKIVNTARHLLGNGYPITQKTMYWTYGWLVGLSLIFAVLSYIVYKKVFIQR